MCKLSSDLDASSYLRFVFSVKNPDVNNLIIPITVYSENLYEIKTNYGEGFINTFT